MMALLKQHPNGLLHTEPGGHQPFARAGGPSGWMTRSCTRPFLPVRFKRLENQFSNRKPEQLAATRASWDLQVRNLKKLRAAGVRIVLRQRFRGRSLPRHRLARDLGGGLDGRRRGCRHRR